MTESDLYRRLARAHRGRVLLQRIETSTAIGVPDLFVQAPGLAAWIELKIIRTRDVRPEWRPGQIGWAHRLILYGGIWAVVFHYENELFFSPYALLDYPDEDFFPFRGFLDPAFLFHVRRIQNEKKTVR